VMALAGRVLANAALMLEWQYVVRLTFGRR
jgi:hypothetical protein